MAKHGIDFLRAIDVFAGPHLILPARSMATEDRRLAIGIIEGLHIALVFTLRGTTIRVISARRARHGEREQHQALYP